MNTAAMFSNYLLKRFQILPLLAIIITDMMVIKRITSNIVIPQWKFYLSFVFIIIYLFHNRVADDKRDFDFDMEFYPDRDLQKGKISIVFLERASFIMIGIMTMIALSMGKLSLLFFLPLLFYTILAKKDFLLPDHFKIKNLFTYNLINMFQLLFLQIFIYVSILDSLALDDIVWTHILFVFILSIQVEITRKVKPDISPGNELYSDRLGMGGAIMLWCFFGLASIIISITICGLLGIGLKHILFFEALILLACFFSGLLYLKNETSVYENLFWLGLLVTYIGQNMILTYA